MDTLFIYKIIYKTKLGMMSHTCDGSVSKRKDGAELWAVQWAEGGFYLMSQASHLGARLESQDKIRCNVHKMFKAHFYRVETHTNKIVGLPCV